jgi:tetratricopeptide (TPR) repeat protein
LGSPVAHEAHYHWSEESAAVDWERFQHATSLWLEGNNERALREFDELVTATADNEEMGSLLLMQARCLLDSGRVKEARERWSEAASCWNNLYANLMDAYLSIEEGKREDAARKLMQWLQRHKHELGQLGDEETFSKACERLGYLLFESQRYGEAIQPLTDALMYPQTDERKRQLCFYIGISCLETLKLADAERSLIESIPPNPEDPLWAKAQFHLGRVYFRKARTQKPRKRSNAASFSATMTPN